MNRILHKRIEAEEPRVQVLEAADCTDVNQLNNRTKYDVTYDDIMRLISGSAGDKQFVKTLSGSYGGNSCWSAEYNLNVIRGECDILCSENTINDSTDVNSLLVPRSKYCVVVEYKRYSDINSENEESETFHYFTVTSGWRSVTVYIN